MTGIELITQERKEQIEKHGWTVKHDKDEHPNGELAIVAAYLAGGDDPLIYEDIEVFVPEWGIELLKKLKGDDIHRLKVAGALIAAEIDRLQALEE